MAPRNEAAQTFKALHKPSSPIILTNIWDVASLNTVLSINDGNPSRPVRAVATASWAIAACSGVKDEELTMEQNLEAILKMAPVCEKANLPLTVDIQDGYGDKIESVAAAVVMAGAVGANIEDSIPSAGFGGGISGSLYPLEKQVQRLEAAKKAAADAGCPDFVINARCDVFVLTPSPELDDEARMKEAIARGKAYLKAGATTVFYWGGPNRGVSQDEVKTLVKELDGRVSVLVSRRPNPLNTSQIAKLGVARISVGPGIFIQAMEAVKASALSLMSGGGLKP